MKQRSKSQRIASIGILSALSIIIAFLKFPLFLPFLEMDFADTPIFIATFMYGPLTGLSVTAIVCIVQGIVVSLESGGPLGILMHFFATGSFVLVAGNIYKHSKTFKGALVSNIIGSITWILVMIPFNLVITPLFIGGYEQGFPEVIKMLPLIVAFNVVKSISNSVITLIVYKHIHMLINKILPLHNEAPLFAKKKEVPNIVVEDNSQANETKNNDLNKQVLADENANKIKN